jgi:hypothetical protein
MPPSGGFLIVGESEQPALLTTENRKAQRC